MQKMKYINIIFDIFYLFLPQQVCTRIFMTLGQSLLGEKFVWVVYTVTLVLCFGPKPKFCSVDLDQAEQLSNIGYGNSESYQR